MLCGIPTSGKSTYVVKHLQETDKYDEYSILSTDAYIEDHALKNNTTYNEVFESLVEQAKRRLNFDLEVAIRQNKGIVWDQTNLTVKTRKHKLSRIPAHYEKIAVWFDLDLDDAIYRNCKRSGKSVPRRVLFQMHEQFTPPTLAEGFDQIIQGN